jgi:hypothetical protein
VTVAKSRGDASPPPLVQKILDDEKRMRLDTLAPYQAFAEHAAQSKLDLLNFIEAARAEGKNVAALGASTKGNVLLQYCGLTENEIFCVGDVNPDKFGALTPGTWIPIIAEDELLAMKPDYLIVLPWHFREFFEQSRKFSGLNLVYPLPEVDVR